MAPVGDEGPKRSRHADALAPMSGGCHFFSHFCDTYGSSPSVPVLNAIEITEGVERRRLPGRPLSSKAKGGASREPPSSVAGPVKASVSDWDSATQDHCGTAKLSQWPIQGPLSPRFLRMPLCLIDSFYISSN